MNAAPQKESKERVEIDFDEYISSKYPCMLVAEKLGSIGFHLNLGIMAPEMWSDEEWRLKKFREAAEKAGASWWAWQESTHERKMVFEWAKPVQ